MLEFPDKCQKILLTHLRNFFWGGLGGYILRPEIFRSLKVCYLEKLAFISLCSRYSSDNSDSSDSSDGNDSSDSSDQTTLYTKKLNIPKTYLSNYPCDSSYCRDSSDGSNKKKSPKNCFYQKNCFQQNFFLRLKTPSHKKSCNLFTQNITQPLHTQKKLQESQNAALRTSHWLSNVSNCSFEKY